MISAEEDMCGSDVFPGSVSGPSLQILHLIRVEVKIKAMFLNLWNE